MATPITFTSPFLVECQKVAEKKIEPQDLLSLERVITSFNSELILFQQEWEGMTSKVALSALRDFQDRFNFFSEDIQKRCHDKTQEYQDRFELVQKKTAVLEAKIQELMAPALGGGISLEKAQIQHLEGQRKDKRKNFERESAHLKANLLEAQTNYEKALKEAPLECESAKIDVEYFHMQIQELEEKMEQEEKHFIDSIAKYSTQRSAYERVKEQLRPIQEHEKALLKKIQTFSQTLIGSLNSIEEPLQKKINSLEEKAAFHSKIWKTGWITSLFVTALLAFFYRDARLA